MPGKPVSVLIPAYNEEERIGHTVGASWEIPGVAQVLVVDDGSRDGTARAALESGAQVIVLEKNRGKGGALNAGAGHLKGDILLLLDADLGKSASRAAGLLGPVIDGLADMVLAVLPKTGKKAGFGLVRGLARAGIRHFTGLDLEAPLSGQRAMRREVLTGCLPLAGGYGAEVDFTVRAAMLGYRVMEVPVDLFHRETGRDLGGFMHRGRQLCHVARALYVIKKNSGLRTQNPDPHSGF
ncbi:MAG: glycosyltransferase family 2 protein [Peptococcaceae bacterium]|nr:glycosyltransferase family 2 protein [Peptococcaceae bacterium]